MEKAEITVDVVRRLIREQHPQWAGEAIAPVELDGWDNTTFRLGESLSVRLPSHDRYVPQVDKEHRWLPVLAPQLPLPIPTPVARGEASATFPRPWSVYRWLDGDVATFDRIVDLDRFADDLGRFLVALWSLDAADGPVAGAHSFQRGASVATLDATTRAAIDALDDDGRAASDVWDAALAAADAASAHDRRWVHGDVTGSNLLVRDGRLSAVLDFGCSAVGDPACDLAIAWTTFEGPSRARFVRTVGEAVDEATWARGRGWALWKALAALRDGMPTAAANRWGWRADVRTVLDGILADDVTTSAGAS